MGRVIAWLSDNQSWLIPLAIYLAMNLAKRDYLVQNPNPVVRGFANALEKVLFLEWNRWGGNLKWLVDE